jgi:hypothetical protein
LAETYSEEIALIRYHVSWPNPEDPFYAFNPTGNSARRNYYGISSVPRLVIDGTDAGSTYQLWEQLFIARYNEPSDWMIIVTGHYNIDSRNAHLNVDIFLQGSDPPGSEYLRIALEESDIYFPAPNGINEHNQTFRDLIPGPSGIPVEIVGGVFETEADFEIDNRIVTENCDIVVFIQSGADREILQGARIPFNDLRVIAADDEPSTPLHGFRIIGNYPNPFNSSTIIEYSIPRRSNVEISIYDILGRSVDRFHEGIKQPGVNRAFWNASDMPSGLYYCIIESESGTVSKPITIVK